mgnify:CR=1 FL=1|tara:strand:- start:41 stop:283 length:243 start_codon:yes stop_codon:yes gene_type:complete
MSETPTLRGWPHSWHGNNHWIPEIGETCKMTEDHGIFKKNEFVTVELPPLGNSNNVTVAKFAAPDITGQVPMDCLLMIED